MGTEDFLAQSCALSRDELVQQGLIASETPCLTAEQFEQLRVYLDLLQRWTRKVDLVSPGDEKTLIKRHIIDSYAAALILDSHASDTASGGESGGILDVGSGAGLPGFVMAVALPKRDILLCEPRAKRCIFLKEVLRELGLEGVAVYQTRMENLSAADVPTARIAVCRALGKTRDFVAHTYRLLGDGAVAAEMLGPNWNPSEQKKELEGLARLDQVVSYSLSVPNSSRNISFWAAC